MTTSERVQKKLIGDDKTAKQAPGLDGMTDLGLVSDIGVRRAIDHLSKILRTGETVRCAASGFLEGRSGLVVATSLRLLFVYKDQTPIDVCYSEIRHFRAKAGIVAAELVIEDSVGRALIKQIHPRGRLAELVTLLHDPVDAENPSRSQPAASDEAAWRPKLRTKVSPLPVRPSDAAQKPSLSRLREVQLATPQPSISASTVPGDWKPRFADSLTDARMTAPTVDRAQSASPAG